jgi:formylglycine-generating enzyme required for sulfatase activity
MADHHFRHLNNIYTPIWVPVKKNLCRFPPVLFKFPVGFWSRAGIWESCSSMMNDRLRTISHRASTWNIIHRVIGRFLFTACLLWTAGHPETRVHPEDSLPYVFVPPGAFLAGCSPGDADCYDAEKPPRRITLSQGFWIGQSEVTVGAYARFARRTSKPMPPEPRLYERPLNPGWSNVRQPMTMVNREDAAAYCAWLGGRLPTAAEWEYAARAGTSGSRYGNLDDIAWYAGNSGQEPVEVSGFAERKDLKGFFVLLQRNGNRPHEVAGKQPNDWGLHDMLGNVWEWCGDHPPALRGGSWFDLPRMLRFSTTLESEPAERSSNIGFRCVLPSGASLQPAGPR